jgi:ribosome-binding factor A
MSLRLAKVNQLIKQEVSKLLQREIGCELGLVTVMDVETTSDLKQAKIWISVFDKDKLNQVRKILEEITPEIQKILNKKLTFKYVPKIIFEIDHSQEHVQRIDKLLKEIKEK